MKLSLLLFIAPVFALWPRPQNLSKGSAPLRLSPSFEIKFSGIRQLPRDLTEAVKRTHKYLKNDKLGALVPDRGASSVSSIRSARLLRTLNVSLNKGATVNSISEEAMKEVGTRSEGYKLSVPVNGDATLTADSTLGLFRGLTTFEQLWYEIDGLVYTLQAPFEIEDSPAYPYRGFMLDTSRNYFPVSDIKRTLDAMSWVKLNQFHWHVVDSQSFPLVVPGFEEISKNGAYSSDQVYTPRDVKDIVSYAAARGIDVMVEIDTPGHTSIIHHSHPEHIACFEASPWTKYANEPPAGQLRLANPETTKFTVSLLKAISSLFPSKLFSTGGDEINQNCYNDDESTQKDLAAQGKTFEQALDTFTQASHDVLVADGKIPVVWQEMVLDHPVTLRNNSIVLVWISSENVAAVAQKGYRLIHAASDYFYLDCGGGGWVGNNPNGNSWCDPFKTWQKAYSFDPTNGLTEDQAKLVLGGQQLLWAEQSGPQNLDSIVWPRAAASAELFWSGKGGNVKEALPRLHEIAYRFVQRGVGAIPLQPQWCALRPNACDLDAWAKLLLWGYGIWKMLKRRFEEKVVALWEVVRGFNGFKWVNVVGVGVGVGVVSWVVYILVFIT